MSRPESSEFFRLRQQLESQAIDESAAQAIIHELITAIWYLHMDIAVGVPRRVDLALVQLNICAGEARAKCPLVRVTKTAAKREKTTT